MKELRTAAAAAGRIALASGSGIVRSGHELEVVGADGVDVAISVVVVGGDGVAVLVAGNTASDGALFHAARPVVVVGMVKVEGSAQNGTVLLAAARCKRAGRLEAEVGGAVPARWGCVRNMVSPLAKA